MKQKLIITIAGSMLLATSLLASNSGLHDSVGKKEQKALQNNGVKGEAAAKAAVEEERSKLLFETKEKEFNKSFKKESEAEKKARREKLQ